MKQSSGKKPLIIAIIVAILIIAAGVATYFALNSSDTDRSANETNTGTDSQPIRSSIEETEVLATIPTQQREISFELMAPQRTGDTLVFNYNLVNTSEDNGYNVSDYRTGVYTIRSSEDSSLASPVQEAYVTASDGKRYGLVSDENGRQLVTARIADVPVQPGERIGGYFTFDLPPSGSTISLYPGDIQAINGIKIEY